MPYLRICNDVRSVTNEPVSVFVCLGSIHVSVVLQAVM